MNYRIYKLQKLTVSVLLRQVSDQVVAIGIFCLALRESGAWNSWARAPHDSRPSFRTWCPFKGYQLIFSGYAKFRQTRLWIRGPIAIKQVFFGRWRWTSICWRFCWWWTPGAPWWKTHPHVAPEHMKYGNFMRLGRQTWTIVGGQIFLGADKLIPEFYKILWRKILQNLPVFGALRPWRKLQHIPNPSVSLDTAAFFPTVLYAPLE